MNINELKLFAELQVDEKTPEIEVSAKSATGKREYMAGYGDALTEFIAMIEEVEIQDVEDHLTDSQKLQLDKQDEECGD